MCNTTYSFADCSPVGQLRELDNLSVPDNKSGLYVLPERVKYSGRLVSIKANGFFINTAQTQLYSLRVSVFRQVCENDVYRQFYIRRFNQMKDNNDAFGTISTTEHLGFQVMKNDLIGIRVDSGCLDIGHCPFQPAIRSNSASQVWYNSEGIANSLEPITGIFLNIEASIGNWSHILCLIYNLALINYIFTCISHFRSYRSNTMPQCWFQ